MQNRATPTVSVDEILENYLQVEEGIQSWKLVGKITWGIVSKLPPITREMIGEFDPKKKKKEKRSGVRNVSKNEGKSILKSWMGLFYLITILLNN